MKNLKVGDKIPSFKLKNQFGENFSIDSVIGQKNLVIYFYPKDNSAGCTKQAQSFRDKFDIFEEEDAIVIGISNQSVESHLEFAKKNKLNFILLSDEDNKIRKLFGVPSNLFGLIPGRVTYVINKEGIIVYSFSSQLNIDKHINETLRILKNLQ